MRINPAISRSGKLIPAKKALGLEILAFPANNFLEQEPGNNQEIQQFCSVNYNVSFPLFSKISVAGDDKHALYQSLISAKPECIGEGPWRQHLIEYGLTPYEAPEILWNFEKFLINKQGQVVARFAPDITAEDPRLLAAIEAELAK